MQRIPQQVLAAVLLLFWCTANGQKQTKLVASLDSLYAATFDHSQPGGAVLIAKDGKVIYKKGFGVEDIQTKQPVTTQSLFNVGSISKTFVAFAILRLADEGKLSLTDHLDKYFPNFHNREIAKKITLYHLLTHTSGLPDNRKIVEDSVFFLSAKDEENFAPIQQTDTLNFEPGEHFEYSNPAFNGLALIIEKVTGRKWQDYVKEIIFRPAGMLHSDITDGPHPESGVTHAYLQNGKQFYEKDYGEEPTFAAAGNGGIWSSVDELWKYEQAIQQHLFLKKQTIDMARTVHPFANWKEASPPFIGLCWLVTKENNYQLIGHTGSQGGFRGDYQWLPEQKLFFVVLCNTPAPIEGLREKTLTVLDHFKLLNKD